MFDQRKGCKKHDDFTWTRPDMAVMTAADLQAARKAAAERFTDIAMSYVPEGYTVEYRKSLSGRHYGMRKLIQAPRPVTRKALYIFLHERARAHLHRDRMPKAHVRALRALQASHPMRLPLGLFDVDPVGGTTGTGFLIGNATAPTS
jgi:hypothetical protein